MAFEHIPRVFTHMPIEIASIVRFVATFLTADSIVGVRPTVVLQAIRVRSSKVTEIAIKHIAGMPPRMPLETALVCRLIITMLTLELLVVVFPHVFLDVAMKFG